MPDIPWLDNIDPPFPDVTQALTDPDGLLAAGGDLTTARLLSAYQQGIFPWYEEDQPVLWWSPDPRCVIYPEQMHVSRSLKKTLTKTAFKITFDSAFSEVMAQCANLRIDQDGTWITAEIITAFEQLHELGVAHSVEVWEVNDDKYHLVGGLYGLAMGKVFFGESMFSRRPNASKIAFYYLCQQLKIWQFNLIDCQVDSEHLQSLGAKKINRDEFITHLEEAIDDPQHSYWNRKA